MRAICTSASLQASTGVSPASPCSGIVHHLQVQTGTLYPNPKGPGGVEHSFCVHTTGAFTPPFSTREVLATISSLRVCLTPWSVFQDGWRHPNSFANIEHHGEASDSPEGVTSFISAHFTTSPSLALVAPRIVPREDNAVGLVLAVEMEVLPLSLSRLQVLCHLFQSAFQTFAHATCSISVFLLCI